MGLTTVPMLAKSRGRRSRRIEMLVDSGAVWSVLPENDWKALGLRPTRTARFALADGTTIERNVSECTFVYEDEEATSPVVLGERDDVALLGAVTLETLALVLNPLSRTLHPMRLMLGQMRARRRAYANVAAGGLPY